MTPSVYILATVSNPALLEAALLVFKTVRTGFPTAHIYVVGNGLEIFAAQEVARAVERVGGTFSNQKRQAHDQWVEYLVTAGGGPFWICDTDIVFFEGVEHWFKEEESAIYSGRYELEFHEEWTNTIHMSRLHTALMWFNAPLVRQAMRGWMGRFPRLWHTAQMNLVRQQFVPLANEYPRFYDTCAGLWHAVGGVPFSEAQDAAFEHLHCATYSDQMRAPGLADLAKVHKAIFQNPAMARGMKRDQDKSYHSRAVTRGPSTLVAPEKGNPYAV